MAWPERSIPVRPGLLEIVLERLRALLGGRLRAAILFGSRARGEGRPGSDWDVAVVVEGVEDHWAEQDRLSRLALELLLETGAAVSFRLLRPGDLDRETLLMESIRREGVPLCTP